MRAMVFAALLLALVPGFAAGQDPPVAQDQQTFQPAPTVVYLPYFVPYVVFVPVVRTHADGHGRAAHRAMLPPPPSQGMFVTTPATGMFVGAPATGIFAASPATGIFAVPQPRPR